MRQWTPLVGQVETKGETDFNNFRLADAYAYLSSFAARYAVGTRVPYNKRQPGSHDLGNNTINKCVWREEKKMAIIKVKVPTQNANKRKVLRGV